MIRYPSDVAIIPVQRYLPYYFILRYDMNGERGLFSSDIMEWIGRVESQEIRTTSPGLCIAFDWLDRDAGECSENLKLHPKPGLIIFECSISEIIGYPFRAGCRQSSKLHGCGTSIKYIIKVKDLGKSKLNPYRQVRYSRNMRRYYYHL